jgi:gliding motility-associated-like protein
MKNNYFNSFGKINKQLVSILILLVGLSHTSNGQIRKAFTPRTSQYSPSKTVYKVKGDFTSLGNTNLTLPIYDDNTNNNGQQMKYVDIDGDPNTFNSSSSTLIMSTENGAIPTCSNIVFAGIYWTGATSPNATFDVTKPVTSPQSVNNDLNIVHNQNIVSTTPSYTTNYTLSVTRGGSNNNYYPVYTFSGNGNTYVFTFFNSGATNRVTLSVNGGTATNIPVTVNGSGTQAILTTPYSITDGSLSIKIKNLNRNAGTNLNTSNTQSNSNADVNVSGTASVTTNVTKSFDRRIIKIKGPNSTSYSQITANTSDIYYPASGVDDNIFTAYAEVTDYVKTNGLGQYTVADIALLEGDPGGTGYCGGWGMVVVYENNLMKWRNVTVFDGYAYVNSANTTGFDLPVSGFNAVQSGNVGVKLGVMATEGDVAFTGDYFKIQNLNSTNYTLLNDSLNATDNFFNSSITAPGTRNPNFKNNTGIDIHNFTLPNTNNAIIGNNQTSTNFKYGTAGDTYSIFSIVMSVDSYVPETESILTATTINNQPAVQPYTTQPGQDMAFNVNIKNLGTEAINNYKLVIPIPFNATYVPGSAVGTVLFTPLPSPNTVTFDPTLGATGSIVWNFGTLPLPANPNTLLAKLTFKLKASTDCTILNNTSCGNAIVVNGTSSGVGATTGIAFNGTKLIQGYTSNGGCTGQPIAASLSINIDGANYAAANCQNTPSIRNFSYCSSNTTVLPSSIASYFPAGSLFYNEFPTSVNSIQYTDANPIPLVAGSTITYYAVPPTTVSGCNFPFTISKCPAIKAQNDTISGGNGTTGNPNVGNVLSNNGNGTDTYNNNPATIAQVTITVLTPATPIGSPTNPVPSVNPTTGQISVPAGTPAGTYTIVYQICDKNNISNCSSATVTITVTPPAIIAQDDTIAGGNGTTGNPNAGNVLSNNGNGADTLNGSNVAIAQVNLTVTTPATPIGSPSNPVPSISTSTGQISIPVGTPAGTYTIVYQICEKLNPTNCDPATVTITVTPPAIIAQDDNYINIECTTSGLIGNVLSNDQLNGGPATSLNVTFNLLTGSNSNITISNNGDINLTSGIPAGPYTFTYQICEKLNPSNCSTASIKIVVKDTTPPVIKTLSSTSTIICPATPVFDQAVANDTCGSVKLTFVDVTIPGSCTGAYSITRTWTATDDSNNTTTASQTINVIDNVAPTWTSTAGSLDKTIECSDAAGLAAAQALAPTATDNCSTVTYTKTSGVFSASGCGTSGKYTNTWTAKDACNNTSSVFTQTITIQDTTAPTWTSTTGSLDKTIECSDATGLAAAQALAPTATDNCDTDLATPVKVAGQFVASSTCPNSGTITNTWTVKDVCGNTSSVFTQTITIQDTTAPTFNAPADITIYTDATCSYNADPSITGTATNIADNCSSNLSATYSDSIANGTCAGSKVITRTWSLVDSCGNAAANQTQTITVTDNIAPTVVSNTIPQNVTVTCDQIPNAVNPTFIDNCTSNITPVLNEVISTVVNGVYTITRTWTGTDACGNISNSVTQVITVNGTTNVTTINYPTRVCSAGTVEYTLDLNSTLPAGTPTGGTWINESNVGTLTGTVFNALGINIGNQITAYYTFSYNYVLSGNCPQKINVIVPVEKCIVLDCKNIIIHNAFTPNGDGINDYFSIENITDSCYVSNKVEIYNRWGVLVYEADNYDNESVVFVGVSNGRATINQSAELPTGTYFYIIEWTSVSADGKSSTEHRQGYLYLSR